MVTIGCPIVDEKKCVLVLKKEIQHILLLIQSCITWPKKVQETSVTNVGFVEK
jgi:hypothetical protein